MTNEEHQTKNDVEVNHGRNSVVPRPRFFFFFFLFSLISLKIFQCWPLEPFTQPPSCLFIAKMALGDMAARPGELLLQPEVTLLAQESWLLHP